MRPKYNPAVARSFAYAIMTLIFLPIEGIFGSNTSPAEYEPLDRARSFLAEHLFKDEPLLMTHAEILNLVEFDVESDHSRVSCAQATYVTIHKGVYNPAKRWNFNALHNLFMDETLIAETRYHMPTVITDNIAELYVVRWWEK